MASNIEIITVPKEGMLFSEPEKLWHGDHILINKETNSISNDDRDDPDAYCAGTPVFDEISQTWAVPIIRHN